FKTLFKRVTETLGGTPTPAPSSSAGGAALANAVAAAKSAPKPTASAAKAEGNGGLTESSMPQPPKDVPFHLDSYATPIEPYRLAVWIEEAFAQGYVAIDTETDGLNPVSASLVGISMALAPGKACYIPVGHGAKADLLSGERPKQIELGKAIEMLKPLLED